MKFRPFSRADVRRWAPWLWGGVVALYVQRVFIEFAPLDWPASWLWPASLAVALAGFAIPLVIYAFGCVVTPVAALIVYLLSPTIDPYLAAVTAFAAVVGVVLLAVEPPLPGTLAHIIPNSVPRPSRQPISDAGVLLISLGVYIATLAPGLLPADSGEFQLVAPTLGIAHPPGYALYTLLGKLFTLIPIRTPAYRLNLMSAVLAAVTLTLVNRTTCQLTRSTMAGLIAVAALAGATTFWAQATTANIRMPTAFFTALLLWLLIQYDKTREERNLVGAALVFGLGVTHHGSLVLIGLPAVLFVLWVQPRVLWRGRLLMRCGVAFTLALLLLLYFPIRGAMDAPLNPGGLTTLDGFLNHVLARGFRGDVLAFTDSQVLLDRLSVLLNILKIQFGRPLLALAAFSAVLLLPRLSVLRPPISQLRSPGSVRRWLLLASTCILIAGIAITYRAPQTVEYLMPAYVPLAILVGVGTVTLARLTPWPTLRAVVLSVALAIGLTNMGRIAPSYRDLSQQSDTRQVVEPILRDAPPNATLLSNWHWATAFWYLQTVEGLRPDVVVQYVTPAGAEPYPVTWRRRLAEALEAGPVLVTNRYPTYADLPARLLPFHNAFLVTTDPVSVPVDVPRLNANFEDTITLLGYSLSTRRLEPDEALKVRLWWQLQADAQHDYSVFVHLVDDVGHPIGQADVRYPADRLTRGALIEDTYTISVLPTVPPYTFRVIAGFYFTPPEGGFRRLTTEGADAVELGVVTVAPRDAPPLTRHPLRVPFGDGPTLIGVDYDTSRPESTRVYLHWQGDPRRPWGYALTRDGERIGGSSVPAIPPNTFVTTALDVPPGTERLGLEVLGSQELVLTDEKQAPQGAWRLPILGSSLRLPRIRPGDRYLVFGGEMALVGARWKRVENEVIVDLEWIGLEPLVRDYTVSVQLSGESGWRAQDDGTPALGAIPTLKWIRGTQVMDRHRIALPPDATGPANIQVSVYDAFTQAPLGVLDDRFQRAGQGRAAMIGRIDGR